MKDYSGNFTNVKEYWMRLNSNCYILLDVKSKISWYSSDINVGYQMWNDKGDGKGCRANSTGFFQYKDSTIINIGQKFGGACLVKYDL